jgi:hypothetical protein
MICLRIELRFQIVSITESFFFETVYTIFDTTKFYSVNKALIRSWKPHISAYSHSHHQTRQAVVGRST